MSTEERLEIVIEYRPETVWSSWWIHVRWDAKNDWSGWHDTRKDAIKAVDQILRDHHPWFAPRVTYDSPFMRMVFGDRNESTDK